MEVIGRAQIRQRLTPQKRFGILCYTFMQQEYRILVRTREGLVNKAKITARIYQKIHTIH